MGDPRLAWALELCQRVVDLHGRYCGRPILATGRGAEWAIVGPALLARASYGVESVLALAERDTDAAVIVRSVYEASTMFAWMAIDPEKHTARWWKEDIVQRLRTVRELHALDPKYADRRASLEAKVKTVAEVPALPRLPQQAEDADKHWVEKLPAMLAHGRTSFRGTYSLIYRISSQSAHGLFLPLTAFVQELGGGKFSIGRPVARIPSLVRVAPYAFGNALAVASLALGWPTATELDEAFSRAPALDEERTT